MKRNHTAKLVKIKNNTKTGKNTRAFLRLALLGILVCFTAIALFLPGNANASPQATPPFVTTSLSPNVMVNIDTSGSMRWGHSNLRYPSNAVYVIAESIYNDPRHGPYYARSWWGEVLDLKGEILQIADNITDPADQWLRVLPGVTGKTSSLHYDPSVFIDLAGSIATIKSTLSSTNHKTMTIGGIAWIVFKGSWGAANSKFDGPYDLGRLSRITMAKWVISKLVQNTTEIQFGIMEFQNGCRLTSGGEIVFPCIDLTKDYNRNSHPDKDDLINHVNSIYPDACTPLANTLYEACRYFGGKTSSCGATYSGAFAPKIMNRFTGKYISPIQYWCQKNFVIIMTDGESYDDGGNVPGNIKDYDHDHNRCDGYCWVSTGWWSGYYKSDSLDDVALYGYDHDFAPSLGNGSGETAKQNFVTYTIGFGGAAATLLKDTADDSHGHGHYYGASDQESLYTSLQSAINDILYRISSGTAVSVLSTSQSTSDKLFRAKFHPLGWKGFLECFSLPYTSGDVPLWEAGELLRTQTANGRTIYTAHSPTVTAQENFDVSNSNITQAMLGVTTRNERRHLINYIRGSYNASWGYRDRDPNQSGGKQWKLGDIIYSTPVVRANPDAFWDSVSIYSSSGVSNYSDFKTNRYNRTPLVIVGANDGMTHAFNISDGSEAWAFVPHNLLYNLKNLGNDPYSHNYYVDLTPVITDCQIGSTVAGDYGWKTVLLSGERQGGKAYIALDITGDTNYPLPLWEFTDGNLGESWSIPKVGLVAGGSTTHFKWMGIFGSGYDNADSKGHLFGINMADGSILFNITVDNATNNVMASPATIDFNDNTCIDHAYIGDILGRMWQATVPDHIGSPWGDAASTTVAVLSSTGVNQSIRNKPSLSLFDRTGGQVIAVYFGTGKFDESSDKTTTDTQSFYCILDEGTLPVPKSDLVNPDTTPITGYCTENGKIPPDKRGWYFNLPNSGERVITSSLVVGGIVFFTSFTPNNDVCGYGGVARLYAVKYDTGCAPDNPVLDVNGDNIVDTSSDSADRPGGIVPKSIIIGVGLPSSPVYDSKNNQIIVQTSDTFIHTRAVSLPMNSFKINYWQEVF